MGDVLAKTNQPQGSEIFPWDFELLPKIREGFVHE